MKFIRVGAFCAVCSIAAWAAVFGTIRGVVHDPDHRPINAAEVVVRSTTSDYSRKLTTDAEGSFEASAMPPGAYTATVSKQGFAASTQEIVVGSGTATVMPSGGL